MNKRMRGNFMLLMAGMIWGAAFIAQSVGMRYVGPFTYNMSRSFIGCFVLIPVVFFFRKQMYKKTPMTKEEKTVLNKNSIIGGIFCGLALGIASCIQQMGVSMTTAGKAGFITALYIIIVPIISIFLGQRIPKKIWGCVAIAIIGFYLLCIKAGFSVSKGDLLCLLCAACFSVHILVIDHFTAQNTDSILMSCVQFLVAALLSGVLTLLFETPTWSAIWEAKLTILYAGVMSSGVAYTLQVVAQRYTDPTVATLLMSLESVFAAVFGWLLLHEILSPKEILGCVLVFTAVVIAQVPLPSIKKRQ